MGQYCAKCFICSNLFNLHNTYVLMHTFKISTYVLTHKYYSYPHLTVDSPEKLNKFLQLPCCKYHSLDCNSGTWTPEAVLLTATSLMPHVNNIS